MAVRTAGLDLGSNSFLVTILERDAAGERVLYDQTTIVGLSRGLDQTGHLDPAAAEQALEVIAEYVEVCRRYRVDGVAAVGTAVFRDASDSAAFRARVKAATGLEIRVISGQEEAALTYRDVMLTHGTPGVPLALMDIGGASSEVVCGADGRLERVCSVDVGSRRLTDGCPTCDPPTADDLDRLADAAADRLRAIEPWGGDLVGTGGTITTLAAIQLALTEYDPAAVNACRLTGDSVAELTRRLAVPLAERERLPGLPPQRAPLMLAGAALTAALIQRLGCDSLGVSAGGLRFAVARSLWETSA